MKRLIASKEFKKDDYIKLWFYGGKSKGYRSKGEIKADFPTVAIFFSDVEGIEYVSGAEVVDSKTPEEMAREIYGDDIGGSPGQDKGNYFTDPLRPGKKFR